MDSFVNGVDYSSSKTRNYEREKGRERRNSQRGAPTNKIHIRNHTLLLTLYSDWVVVCTAQLLEGNTLFVATSMCRWVGYTQDLKPCTCVNGSLPPSLVSIETRKFCALFFSFCLALECLDLCDSYNLVFSF